MPQNFSINPLQTAVDNNGKTMSTEWRPWFQTVSTAVNSLYQYGTTAQRPTINLYLGQLYFDQTLGTMVMLTNLSPVTWTPFAVISTFTPDAFLYSNSGGAITATAAATNGQLLIGSTGNVPVAATLTGTANEVLVSNGSGTITLSTPQPINTTSSVTFANITDSALTPNSFIYPTTAGLFASTAAATNGQLLIGSTGNVPVAATLTAGSGISIANAAGSITISANGSGVVTSITGTSNEIIASSSTGNVTLSTPQAIATTSSVTFANVTSPGTVQGSLLATTGNIQGPATGYSITTATGIGSGGAIQLFDATHGNEVAILNGGSNVAVFSPTGINSAAIGATTPSTGAFTTLSANSASVVTLTNTAASGGTLNLTAASNTSNGVQIFLGGNGATTPNKYLRVLNGTLQVLNSAGSTAILTLTDAGDLSAINIDNTPIGATTPATGVFTSATAVKFITATASALTTTGVATTIVSLANQAPACYLVTANIGTQNDTTHYGAFAVVYSDGTSARLATVNNGTLQTITLSGLNIQSTQSTGVNQTITMVVTRIA
jgi:hypothetical protein